MLALWRPREPERLWSEMAGEDGPRWVADMMGVEEDEGVEVGATVAPRMVSRR